MKSLREEGISNDMGGDEKGKILGRYEITAKVMGKGEEREDPQGIAIILEYGRRM